MIYKFQFCTEEDKQSIVEANNDKYVIEINYFKNGNVIIFSDEQSLENKVSILEAENKILREELAQMQASIASLMAITLEEK